MGIFRRLFPQRDQTLKATDLCSGDFHFAIVGEGSYQSELQRIAGDRMRLGEKVEVRVVLIPEPKNKFDANAVAVHAENGGVIGYLARDDAAEYQRAIIQHMRTKNAYPSCKARLFGGTPEKPSIGAWIDIDWDAL